MYPERDPDYVPIRNRGNEYLLNRRMQKDENFTGIVGVSEQDAAIQDSQGVIADRTRELLGPTDIAVVQFRRLMLESAAAVQSDQTPLGRDDPQAFHVRGGGTVAPATDTFEQVMQRRFADEFGRVRYASEAKLA